MYTLPCSNPLCSNTVERYKSHIIRYKNSFSSECGRGAPKIYSVNNNYFSVPTIKNCQWAGYIAADGCITGNGKVVKLTCKTDDLEMIETIKVDIQSTYPISKITANLNNGKTYYGWNMIFRSSQIINDLDNNFGIGQRKSLTMQPPPIRDINQKLAFMIGLINGDGSIYRPARSGVLSLNITGTLEICEWCRELYSRFYPLDKKYIYKNGKSVFSFAISNATVNPFLEMLLGFDCYFLPRKWDKVLIRR